MITGNVVVNKQSLIVKFWGYLFEVFFGYDDSKTFLQWYVYGEGGITKNNEYENLLTASIKHNLFKG